MGYFPVRYDSRVVIYEHKMFKRLATDVRFLVTNFLTTVAQIFDHFVAYFQGRNALDIYWQRFYFNIWSHCGIFK